MATEGAAGFPRGMWFGVETRPPLSAATEPEKSGLRAARRSRIRGKRRSRLHPLGDLPAAADSP